ncbi:hypothetical protein C8F04DRAFT_1153615, partial [Mycena alexandri]
MPPEARDFDLKQVAKLFNDTIAVIRDDIPDVEALQPQAIEWLKAARYQLMRDIEAQFYSLEKSRHTPLSQPGWAVDPAQSLYTHTVELPTVLDPYSNAIASNLSTLLQDCGFEHCSCTKSFTGGFQILIHFPAQLPAAPQPQPLPLTMEVEDEFSQTRGGNRQARTGAFGGTHFARLLIEARGQTGGEGAAAATASNNRRATKTPKEESDEGTSVPTKTRRRRTTRVTKAESDDEQPRLRSVTLRASSTATLRESKGNVRRSSR